MVWKVMVSMCDFYLSLFIVLGQTNSPLRRGIAGVLLVIGGLGVIVLLLATANRGKGDLFIMGCFFWSLLATIGVILWSGFRWLYLLIPPGYYALASLFAYGVCPVVEAIAEVRRRRREDGFKVQYAHKVLRWTQEKNRQDMEAGARGLTHYCTNCFRYTTTKEESHTLYKEGYRREVCAICGQSGHVQYISRADDHRRQLEDAKKRLDEAIEAPGRHQREEENRRRASEARAQGEEKRIREDLRALKQGMTHYCPYCAHYTTVNRRTEPLDLGKATGTIGFFVCAQCGAKEEKSLRRLDGSDQLKQELKEVRKQAKRGWYI